MPLFTLKYFAGCDAIGGYVFILAILQIVEIWKNCQIYTIFQQYVIILLRFAENFTIPFFLMMAPSLQGGGC